MYANQLPLKSCCGGRGSDDWVSCPGVGGITLETNKGPPGSWLWLPRRTLIQIIILITCFLSQVISQRVIIICVAYYICFCAGWSSLSWYITKTNWKERGQCYFVNKLSMWFGKKIKVLWTQESNYDLLVSNPDALPLSYRRLRDGPLENIWGGGRSTKKKIRAREN